MASTIINANTDGKPSMFLNCWMTWLKNSSVGLSDRTLQRRIDDDGTTFRKLLLEARQELAREYLNRADIDVAEVACLLGYEDSNSFYRAFRTWEGTTPSQLRAELKRPVN